MAENLSYEQFPINSEADENDQSRPGAIILEFHPAVSFTVSTNLAEAEVPTALGQILGVMSAGLLGTFAAGDTAHGMTTDGVITTGAVTVRMSTVSLGDGAHTASLILIGKKGKTVLFNTPDNPS